MHNTFIHNITRACYKGILVVCCNTTWCVCMHALCVVCIVLLHAVEHECTQYKQITSSGMSACVRAMHQCELCVVLSARSAHTYYTYKGVVCSSTAYACTATPRVSRWSGCGSQQHVSMRTCYASVRGVVHHTEYYTLHHTQCVYMLLVVCMYTYYIVVCRVYYTACIHAVGVHA